MTAIGRERDSAAWLLPLIELLPVLSGTGATLIWIITATTNADAGEGLITLGYFWLFFGSGWAWFWSRQPFRVGCGFIVARWLVLAIFLLWFLEAALSSTDSGNGSIAEWTPAISFLVFALGSSVMSSVLILKFAGRGDGEGERLS